MPITLSNHHEHICCMNSKDLNCHQLESERQSLEM
jgi:hypothetical protein